MDNTLESLLHQLFFEDDKEKAQNIMNQILGMFETVLNEARTYEMAHGHCYDSNRKNLNEKHIAINALRNIAFNKDPHVKKLALVKIAKSTLEKLHEEWKREWQANGTTGVDPVSQR